MAWQKEEDHVRFTEQPFRRFIPNLITIAGLCCGLSAIRFAVVGRWELAVTFIIVAAFIDGMDGRAARMLRATSLFGAQLDSLSDFLCFGVAPALVLYFWQLHDIRGFGWAVTLFFAVCCALRLARFNTAVVENKQEPWQKKFFVGVPSPAGGIMCLMPLILMLASSGDFVLPAWMTAVHVLLMAVLMASRLPTFAAKHVRIKPHLILPVMMACAFIVVMLVIETWWALIVLGVGYLLSIPFSVRYYRQLQGQSAATV